MANSIIPKSIEEYLSDDLLDRYLEFVVRLEAIKDIFSGDHDINKEVSEVRKIPYIILSSISSVGFVDLSY